MYFSGDSVFVLAMNGYSDIGEEKCIKYGVKQNAYETACAGLLSGVIEKLQATFRGVKIVLAHGASNMGVHGM